MLPTPHFVRKRCQELVRQPPWLLRADPAVDKPLLGKVALCLRGGLLRPRNVQILVGFPRWLELRRATGHAREETFASWKRCLNWFGSPAYRYFWCAPSLWSLPGPARTIQPSGNYWRCHVDLRNVRKSTTLPFLLQQKLFFLNQNRQRYLRTIDASRVSAWKTG